MIGQRVLPRLAILLALVVELCLGACNRKPAGPSISASPNPVPPGSGTGRTTITWTTGDGRPARVTVAVGGSDEALFAFAPYGSRDAPWIGDGVDYEFRLREADTGKLLASVTVRRGISPVLVAGAVLLVLVLIGAASWAVRRRTLGRRTDTRPAQPRSWRFWIVLIIVVVGVKLILLALDSTPRIYLGDSGYYLYTSLTDVIPYERSFTYGRVIRVLAGDEHAIARLIAAQVLASAAAALLLAIGLRVGFGAPLALVAAGTLLVTVEPLQLAYERFVMTEALAGLGYAALIVGTLWYVRRPRAIVLPVLALVGLGLLSLRLNAVFLAAILPITAPLLAWRRVGRGWRSGRPWLHLAIAFASVFITHAAYRRHYGHLQAGPAAYHYASGRTLLVLASPLVRPEDIPEAVRSRILSQVKVPLGLPREQHHPLQVRDSQWWSANGIAEAVARSTSGVLPAEALSAEIGRRAVRRDPLGTLHLGILTLRGYFDPTLRGLYDFRALRTLIVPDLGPTAVPRTAELVAFGIGQASSGPSLIRRWHVAGLVYYPFLLLCPLGALWLTLRVNRERRPEAFVLLLASVVMVLTGPGLSLSPIVRFLHPLAWMGIFLVILLAGRVGLQDPWFPTTRETPRKSRNGVLGASLLKGPAFPGLFPRLLARQPGICVTDSAPPRAR